jgi:ubiquitin C-terminal hydrolase
MTVKSTHANALDTDDPKGSESKAISIKGGVALDLCRKHAAKSISNLEFFKHGAEAAERWSQRSISYWASKMVKGGDHTHSI